MFIYLSIFPSFHAVIYLFYFLCTQVSIYVFIYLSIHLFLHLSTAFSLLPISISSIFYSFHPPIYLHIHLSIFSIYLQHSRFTYFHTPPSACPYRSIYKYIPHKTPEVIKIIRNQFDPPCPRRHLQAVPLTVRVTQG
ncbi:hypothetical protein E2C01_084114 [Portunus trituberculatus]|uniref:Uncharacterized protein n=1 Tax=Portunus trituberculatus TaxID=210409 RepID=A0A5B7J3F1_PORTR|nr:hypothetical protein [Portunus trituberculatus]